MSGHLSRRNLFRAGVGAAGFAIAGPVAARAAQPLAMEPACTSGPILGRVTFVGLGPTPAAPDVVLPLTAPALDPSPEQALLYLSFDGKCGKHSAKLASAAAQMSPLHVKYELFAIPLIDPRVTAFTIQSSLARITLLQRYSTPSGQVRESGWLYMPDSGV